MKKRNSIIFGESKEINKPAKLKVITKFPKKWVLIDTEKGHIYQGSENEKINQSWNNIYDKNILKKLIKLLKKMLNNLR